MNVKKWPLLMSIITCSTALTAQQTAPVSIQLNQQGFYPNAMKIAVVTTPVTGNNFYLLSVNLKDTLFTGKLGAPLASKSSSLTTHIADFSSFKKQGRYIVAVPGSGNSFAFSIANQVHQSLAVAVLKGYYYQRVSMPLEPGYAGKWSRPAGHADTAVLIHPSAASPQRPAGTVISSPGGWYDAGDYNKYIVNSGISMGTMLSAFEDFTVYFNQLKTNIPESNNTIPDILDEALYNLRWMFTMQDPADGGVYNKCTNANFDGMVMPGVTKAPRYVVQKGTAATLDFAAVMAQSSRLYKKFSKVLPGLADSCLKAAELAWKWAAQNPKIAYDQTGNNKKFVPQISTGGYGDGSYEDEFFWAACELYCTTGSDQYLATIQLNSKGQMNIPSWGNVKMMGYYTLFRHAHKIPAGMKGFVKDATAKFLLLADGLQAGTDSSAFKTVMGKSRRDFNWGSNANAANQAIALINAYVISKQAKYMEGALSNLDYLAGRNATCYSFVTGMGSRSPMHPHHRPSEADGIAEPVPGLLVGGPNPGMQDKCTYAFTEPETAYTDLTCSYASNEIAINWNAPLVYLANAIEALQYAIGYSQKK